MKKSVWFGALIGAIVIFGTGFVACKSDDDSNDDSSSSKKTETTETTKTTSNEFEGKSFVLSKEEDNWDVKITIAFTDAEKGVIKVHLASKTTSDSKKLNDCKFDYSATGDNIEIIIAEELKNADGGTTLLEKDEEYVGKKTGGRLKLEGDLDDSFLDGTYNKA